MAGSSNAPQATEQVLSTLNVDGTRRWIRPKFSKGSLWQRRRIVGWGLIAIFTALPHLRLGGHPALMLDLRHARLHAFGATFHGTETFFLMVLLLSVFFSIFLITAILGRAWCGWACPQTVYLEFLYRPLGRWIEGGRGSQLKTDAHRMISPRRVLSLAVFLGVSAVLANTFLGYFVPSDEVLRWMTSPPAQHPAAFTLVVIVTMMIFVDFSWFREQTCLVACPYGRFQSVLLDADSWIVSYDPHRGERRGTARDRKRAEEGSEPFGDCIDCFKCVTTCPTGIDIRNGLQMECVHCTQCIDACDEVMIKTGREPGLVRYSTKSQLAGRARRYLRPRVAVYATIITILMVTGVTALSRRQSLEATLLRAGSSPFITLPDGRISNPVQIRLGNRSGEAIDVSIELLGDAVAPIGTLASVQVEAEGNRIVPLVLAATAGEFTSGTLDYRIRFTSSEGQVITLDAHLLGPAGGPS